MVAARVVRGNLTSRRPGHTPPSPWDVASQTSGRGGSKRGAAPHATELAQMYRGLPPKPGPAQVCAMGVYVAQDVSEGNTLNVVVKDPGLLSFPGPYKALSHVSPEGEGGRRVGNDTYAVDKVVFVQKPNPDKHTEECKEYLGGEVPKWQLERCTNSSVHAEVPNLGEIPHVACVMVDVAAALPEGKVVTLPCLPRGEAVPAEAGSPQTWGLFPPVDKVLLDLDRLNPKKICDDKAEVWELPVTDKEEPRPVVSTLPCESDVW